MVLKVSIDTLCVRNKPMKKEVGGIFMKMKIVCSKKQICTCCMKMIEQ